jgi:hypothetical protein
MKKHPLIILTTLTLVTVPLFFNACSASVGNLEIEAQIVYQIGGPQPVARETFYLYDVDPATLNIPGAEKSRHSIATWITSFNMGGSSFGPSKDVEAVTKPHIVKTVKTDFQGKAVFNDLTPRDYWLVGKAETRGNFPEYWIYEVIVRPGDNKVLLSQDNSIK